MTLWHIFTRMNYINSNFDIFHVTYAATAELEDLIDFLAVLGDAEAGDDVGVGQSDKSGHLVVELLAIHRRRRVAHLVVLRHREHLVIRRKIDGWSEALSDDHN